MDPVLDVCAREPIMDPVLDVCVREPIMDPVYVDSMWSDRVGEVVTGREREREKKRGRGS